MAVCAGAVALAGQFACPAGVTVLRMELARDLHKLV